MVLAYCNIMQHINVNIPDDLAIKVQKIIGTRILRNPASGTPTKTAIMTECANIGADAIIIKEHIS